MVQWLINKVNITNIKLNTKFRRTNTNRKILNSTYIMGSKEIRKKCSSLRNNEKPKPFFNVIVNR